MTPEYQNIGQTPIYLVLKDLVRINKQIDELPKSSKVVEFHGKTCIEVSNAVSTAICKLSEIMGDVLVDFMDKEG